MDKYNIALSNCRKMSDGRKRLSGAEYRKKAKIKKKMNKNMHFRRPGK